MLVPLPPLAEQHRIVAKVDELMALCDQLEAMLSIGDDTRRQLLDALLHEAWNRPLPHGIIWRLTGPQSSGRINVYRIRLAALHYRFR